MVNKRSGTACTNPKTQKRKYFYNYPSMGKEFFHSRVTGARKGFCDVYLDNLADCSSGKERLSEWSTPQHSQ
jgi:hypothetical protein